MPNIIFTAAQLSGTPDNLADLRFMLMVENVHTYALAISDPEARHVPWDVRWTMLSPSKAIVSFCEAWEPSALVARQMVETAKGYSVSVDTYAAIEERIILEHPVRSWSTPALTLGDLSQATNDLLNQTGRFAMSPQNADRLHKRLDAIGAVA